MIQKHEMTDEQLDRLIAETFQREQLLEQVERQVMSQVRAASRRAWLRRWGRLVAFSLGLPAVALCHAYGIWRLSALVAPSLYILVATLSSAALLAFLCLAVREFPLAGCNKTSLRQSLV